MPSKKALTTWHITSIRQQEGIGGGQIGRLVSRQTKNPMPRCTSHHTHTQDSFCLPNPEYLWTSACCA
jgi:hypothetical protein